jgi:hypothetical protein
LDVTISSLQIGQTSLVVAATAADESPLSSDTLELISGGSKDTWEFETWDCSDTELSDGDNKLECFSGVVTTGAVNERPPPRTLPPPSFLDAIVVQTEDSLLPADFYYTKALSRGGGLFHLNR